MSGFKRLIDNATIQMHEQRTDYLSSGECGAALLATLHADIDKIRTLPDTADDFIFETIPELLKKGLEAGEPAMMFLAAEFSHYAAFSKTYSVPYDRGVDPAKTYLRASQAGSVHATLWCAFCYDTEPEKYPEYQYALETARRLPPEELPEEPMLTELSFLEEEFLSLVEEAHDADLEEDNIGDSHNWDWDAIEDLLPNPSWRSLHERYVELAMYMLCLGLDYITSVVGYRYAWVNELNDWGAFVRESKEALRAWYRDFRSGIN